MKNRFLLVSLLILNFSSYVLADSTPVMSRIYGDYFVEEAPQEPSIGVVGALDLTFNSTGSFSLATQFASGQPRAIQVLSDGTFVVAVSKSGSNSDLIKYTSLGTPATFGTSSVASLGTNDPVQAMIVDAQGRFIVGAGDDTTSGTSGYVKGVSADGTSVSSAFSGSITWQFVGALAQQSSGNIIAVGSNNVNAQIARYTAAGVLDATFGAAATGMIIFNGTQISSLSSTNGIYNVVVDASDNIYVAYLDGTTTKVAMFDSTGALVSGFGTAGIQAVSYLASATASQIRMAMDLNSNLVIAAQVSSNVKVTAIAASNGGTASPAFTNFATSGGNTYDIRSLITTTDGTNGKILIFGSNETTKASRVTRLTSAGVLDVAGFNATGFNEFLTGTTSSFLFGAALSPDGQIYVAGYQVNSSTTTPYVSRLYNDLSVSQVAQFPASQEQGNLDLSFGSSEEYPGVVSPFNGLYGQLLKQQAQSIIDLSAGGVLVGMNGKTNTSANSNMMLARLTDDGGLDTTFNSGSATITLPSQQTDEYLNALLEDQYQNIYVAGYSTTGAIFRQYSSSGSAGWICDNYTSPNYINISGYQGLNITLQGATRLLLSTQVTTTTGRISAHNVSDGKFDTGFHSAGSTPGVILPTDFGLNMGPIYSTVVGLDKNIYTVYKNSSTGAIDVAAILPDGSGLITGFGSSGVYANVFSATNLHVDSARIALDWNENLLVAVTTGTGLQLARIIVANGDLDSVFNSGAILSIPLSGTTSVSLKSVVGVSDGSIMLTANDSAADDTMFVVRVTVGGALDATFDSQGANQGILPIKIGDRVSSYTRVATGLIIQSLTGNILVSGYEQQGSNDSTPIVLRIYGQPSTTQMPSTAGTAIIPGTLDPYFNSTGFMDVTSLIGAGSANVVYAYRNGNTYQNDILVGIDTGSASLVARVNEIDGTLEPTFATASSNILSISNSGISHISLDANNKIIVGGTKAGSPTTGWATRLTTLGVVDHAFASTSSLAAINQIYQQRSGRYIVAGVDGSGNGILVAYQDHTVYPATTLAIDTTFNPLAVGSAAGTRIVGTTGAYNLAINSDDTMLVAYSDTTVKVAKIKANGSGLVSSFGASGILDTTITPKNASEIRLVIDAAGKIIVAASTSSNTLKVARYTAAGSFDSSSANSNIPFNSGAIRTISSIGSANVTLTDVLETIDNEIVLLGYNTAGASGFIFASRLAHDGSLDATWNVGASSTFTLNMSDTSETMGAGSIASNGNIYAVATGSTNNPYIMEIYGNSPHHQNDIEVEQQPFESLPGVLDLTLDTLTPSSGALNLNILFSATLGIPQKLYMYSTGSMLIASSLSGTTYLSQLKADLTPDTTFGSSGIVTISSDAPVSDIYVANGTNDIGSILLTGIDSGVLWAAEVTSNGQTVTNYAVPNTVANMTVASTIRKTSNGRILIAGENATSGIVAAFTADGSKLDLSFADGVGYYETGIQNGIYHMAVDSLDRMYIAYKNAGTPATINVQRIMANGGGVDTTFGPYVSGSSGPRTGTIVMTGTSTLSATEIKIVLDETNEQLIVAYEDGTGTSNALQVARFSSFDGSTAGNVTGVITIANKNLNLVDLFIDEKQTINSMPIQHIYVIGYNATDSNAIVARIKSTSSTLITLDSVYAAGNTTPDIAGVADVSAGAITVVGAGALNPDRRVYIVGNNGSSVPYLARLFGDEYTSEVAQVNPLALVGTIDLTLDPNDMSPVGGIDLSSLANWSGMSTFVPQAVYANADGTLYIAMGDGTNVVIGKVDADMNPVSTFGTHGLTATQAMTSVNSLAVDAAGKILVSGTNTVSAVNSQDVLRYTSAGALDLAISTSLDATVGTTIAEQKSGRILVGGLIGSTGALCAYQNGNGNGLATPATIAPDNTFGPSTLNGYYATGINSPIDDFVIDGSDFIYIVYRDASDYLILEKIAANGSGKVYGFNAAVNSMAAGQAINTGIAASSSNPVRIAINNAGTLLVGATTGSGIVVQLYNAATGATIGSSLTMEASATNPVLTKIVGCGANFIGSIYSAVDSNMMTFSVLGSGMSVGQLDPSFNSAGSPQGIAVYDPQSATAMNGIAIQPDGRIVMVGKNSSKPILMRLYGYQYVAQDPQYPGKVSAGRLDSTLPSEISGVLEFDTAITGLSSLSGYSVKRMHEYSDGTMLFAADNGTNTILFRLLKDLTLDTAGFGISGLVTISSEANVSSLFVDGSNNIFVAGGSTTSWVRAYNSSGVALTTGGWTTPTANLSAGVNVISRQTCQRVIVAGQGYSPTSITNGVLLGYTITGELDLEFGANGVVDTKSADIVTGMVIDSNDQILISYVNSSASVIKRITASGQTINLLSSGTAISNVTSSAKVVQDNNNKIIVAASTVNGFSLRRYNNNGSDDTTVNMNNVAPAQINIAAGGSSTSHLAALYVTSDGKAVIIGYETTGNTIIVARVSADFTELDPSFNGGVAFAQTIGSSGEVLNQAFDGTIHADDRIMIVGSNSATPEPYMARVFGDNYVTVTAQSPIPGVAGYIDTTFGTAGQFTGAISLTSLNGMQGRTVMTQTNGSYYVGLNDGTTSSQLIRVTADNILDHTYGGGNGLAAITPDGLTFMAEDGSSRVLVGGTSNAGEGWLARFVAGNLGTLDTFGSSGVMNLGSSTTANAVVELSMARLVVAGSNSTGGALFGLTNTGAVDTTFGNGTGVVNLPSSNTNAIYALAADSLDRLIIAYLNTAGSAIDLARLTPTGEFDPTFGTSGVVAGVIANADVASQVCVLVDQVGNIVVAAHTTVTSVPQIAIVGYDNLTASNGNGQQVYTQYNLTGLTAPVLKQLVATADSYVFAMGNQSGTNPMWVARLIMGSPITLDIAEFNATGGVSGAPGLPGIFMYGSGLATHVYNGMSVREDGRLVIIGSETLSGVITPTMVRVYNDPYTYELAQTPDSHAIGTNDTTFGLANSNGVNFSDGVNYLTSYNQMARAIAMQDANNMIVALDGQSSTSAGSSEIFINMFDTNGLPNINFNSTGQATVSLPYDQNHVNDMIVFNSNGVNKAILAGYASTGSPLNLNGSLLMQYDLSLTGSGLDSSFGGLSGNGSGIAFGDGQELFSVSRQSIGRIITSGLSQDNHDLILAYTPAGKLDKTFASGGYYSKGTNPIYTHVIDSNNNIVIAYNDGSNNVAVARILADGSNLDANFGTAGLVTSNISGISGNSNMRVAIDQNHNILVAAVNNSGVDIVVYRYTSAGVLDTTLTIASAALGGNTAVTISKLLVDSNGKAIIVGYDNAVQDEVIVARTTSNLSGLDAGFNATPGTPGYIKYIAKAGGTQVATDAMIHADGRIIVIGANN